MVIARLLVGLLLVGCLAACTGGTATPTAVRNLPDPNATPNQRVAIFGFTRTAVLGVVVDRELRVVGVEPGGPAARAGIQPDDRIIAVNNAPVSSIGEARDRLRQAGPEARIMLLRGIQRVTVWAQPGPGGLPAGQPTPTPIPPPLDYL